MSSRNFIIEEELLAQIRSIVGEMPTKMGALLYVKLANLQEFKESKDATKEQ